MDAHIQAEQERRADERRSDPEHWELAPADDCIGGLVWVEIKGEDWAMQKFRRKYEEIEAQPFNSKSLDRPPGVSGHGDGRWFININGSEIDVVDGDWVTYSEHGTGVCRSDYFHRMYEPVVED